MDIIKHRVNTIEELLKLPIHYGCEVDLRTNGKRIYISHDCFESDGDDFKKWLKNYNHKFLIANVKEEGMEPLLLELLREYSIEKFFILDESFPFMRKWALNGLSNFAVRVSELESYNTALLLASDLALKSKSVTWVWVDTFSLQPLQKDYLNKLIDVGYKTCYVSPELHIPNQKKLWTNVVKVFINQLELQGIIPDAVCTKMPDLWESYGKSSGNSED